VKVAATSFTFAALVPKFRFLLDRLAHSEMPKLGAAARTRILEAKDDIATRLAYLACSDHRPPILEVRENSRVDFVTNVHVTKVVERLGAKFAEAFANFLIQVWWFPVAHIP